MIEKLDIPQSTVIDASVLWGGINDNVLAAKINEVIDAVNELTSYVGPLGVEFIEPKTPAKNVQDDYAQYRDWAGKLCRFWNIDKDKAIYGILEEVKADWAYRFQMKGEKYLFDHCEPVKPDDDIIYKGGDNE